MKSKDHESDSYNPQPNRWGETRIFHDHLKSSEYVDENGMRHPSEWSNDPRSESSTEKHFRGKGPKNYQRSDRRIYEELGEELRHNPTIDASEIEFSVRDRHIYVRGFVKSKTEKWLVEDILESLHGIEGITNELKLRREEFPPRGLIKGIL